MTPLRGHGEDGTEAMRCGQRRLKSHRREFEHKVVIGAVVEPPIHLISAFWIPDEPMTNFVEDHLREAIVGIEVIGPTDLQ